jgi:capsule polysaccharide export protein KpsE/RkpR
MPPESQSNSTLAMLSAVTGKFGPGLEGLAGDALGVKTPGAVFVDVLRSRTIADRIIDKYDLRRVYWDKYYEDARKDLAKRLDIAEDRKSGVITVSITDRNPKRAQAIAQSFLDELDRLLAQVSTSAARRQRIFIEQRLALVQQNLDAAATQFSVFASKNAAIDISAQTKATVEAEAELQAEYIAAQSELEGMQQIYSDSNVRVRSARARIDELRRQLQKLGGNAGVADGYDPAKELYPPLRELPILGVKWADLYREVKTQEAVYELLTQQYELARIQEAKEIPTVKVLDSPDAPERKSYPPRLLIILPLTVVSLTAVVVFILLRERWRMMSPVDPRKLAWADLRREANREMRALRLRLRSKAER